MAESDYRSIYKQFFEEFAKTVSPDDQLPVKVAGYNLCENELTGEIVDWILQYLGQKRCPSSLLAPLTTMALTEIRQAIRENPVACGYLRENNVFHSLRLMQFVITVKVNEVCLRYLSPGSIETFPPPPPELQTTACAIKNNRRRMEDRHTIIEDFHTIFDVKDAGLATYYGVFDGHAGTDAAIYGVSHLHQFLAESPLYPSNPVEALREAFLKTDELFLEKSRREDLRSGTTALCAVLQHTRRMLYVGWVGDSQAVLVSRGRPRQLVVPHKPERPDERQRIEDMGGCILYWGTWRVNGQLAVSRAIGDLDYKPYVSAEPDIQAIPLDDNQDFLILACDGLWDFVTEQDAVVSVYNTIREHPGDLEAVSQNLVQLSKQKSSLDNISVIVVFLTDPATLAALDVWPTPEPETMDTTSFETNPFQTNGDVQHQTNGSDPAYQKANLLLDLNTGDKYSGKEGGGGVTSPSATDLCFLARPTNGKEDVSYDEDDFGPETDVDAVDDVLLSPAIAAAKAAAAAAAEEEGVAGGCAEKDLLRTEIEADLELQRQQLSVFDPVSEPREETPTPPADDVPGGPLLAPEVDNVAESGEESEDEWNYYRGEQSDEPAAATEAPAKTAQEIEDDENMESRLNPNAAEFIPSPTATKPSMEEVLSASPLKGGVAMDNVTIPSSLEFQQEVSLRPAEIDAGNPFSANDDFFNTVPDFVNGKEDECANLEKAPYQALYDSTFVDFPDRLNPFKASEHLFDKSEVSSTKAEFGDETTTSFVSDSEQLLKPFVDDPLNASMVESDFLMDNDINFQSNTSTDMFGLDLTQDITQSNTSTLSPLDENEMFPVASAPEAMHIDGENAIDYQDQFASNLAAEAQAMSPPVSPMPAEVVDTKPTVPEESPFEQASAFADQVSDIVMHFEEHTEQNFSPFPDIVQESSLYNEFKEQAYACREAAQSDFSDLVAPVGINADYIEEFKSEFESSVPEQQATIHQSGMSHEAYDFFNGPPSRELVTEAMVEPVGRNEIVGACLTGFEEFEDNAHDLLPAEEAAALPALEAVAPALEAVAPALEAAAPALEAVAPALEAVTSPQEADTTTAESDATVIAATAAVAAAGIAAGVAALAVGAPTPSKEAAKKEVKKLESDKTKSTPAAGTRTPAKTPLKSTPSSPTKPLPTAAPRSSSTPKKPPTTPSAAPSRVASKTAAAASKVGAAASPVSKVAASTTSHVRAKVGASSPTKPAPLTKVAPAKTAIVPPKPRPATATAAKTVLADKKPALSNGDVKPIAKRSEQPITKKLVPTAATKPLTRPASAPVATKATKTSTVTRTTTTTVSSAASKPAAKPAVNGVAKPKPAAAPLAPRAKPIATSTTLKTGLVDKQVKETANKQISRTVASKTSTTTRTATSSVTGPRRPAGTATKTTTTTTTTSNKPSGPIRRPAGTAVTKTTTMKVVDPQTADGEQMVIVQEVTTTITKDESPIADNAHIEVISVND